MPQSTRRWITQKVDELRNAPQLPFHDLLDPATVNQVLDKNQVSFRDRIFSPLVTLWTFLSQVLSLDHSCREAVARLIAFRVSNGQEPCGPETGSYCKARQRLLLKVITDLVQGTAQRLQEQAPDSWLWKGREVALVDGSTVSMPDTAANQEVFPQPSSQKPGVGFPLARLVAVISLTTGALRALAVGPYSGKETGETALFRTLWDHLKAGEIVLGDRYFASFCGIAPLVQRGIDGLFRMHQKRKYDFRRGQAGAAGLDGGGVVRATAGGAHDPRVAGAGPERWLSRQRADPGYHDARPRSLHQGGVGGAFPSMLEH